MPELLLLSLLFFVIALIYSSVGFGGGSSYIALLLWLQIPVPETRMLALVCNIIVVLGASINFYKSGILQWQKVLPLVLLSIPAAFLGGMIQLPIEGYLVLVGFVLLVASILMLLPKWRMVKFSKSFHVAWLTSIGGGIGFLSGIVGIGGGIFLAPVLHLAHWEKPQLISAACSAFILVNSIAGIFGQATLSPQLDWSKLIILGLAVLVGGQMGNLLNIRSLSPQLIRIFSAFLIGFIGLRLSIGL